MTLVQQVQSNQNSSQQVYSLDGVRKAQQIAVTKTLELLYTDLKKEMLRHPSYTQPIKKWKNVKTGGAKGIVGKKDLKAGKRYVESAQAKNLTVIRIIANLAKNRIFYSVDGNLLKESNISPNLEDKIKGLTEEKKTGYIYIKETLVGTLNTLDTDCESGSVVKSTIRALEGVSDLRNSKFIKEYSLAMTGTLDRRGYLNTPKEWWKTPN